MVMRVVPLFVIAALMPDPAWARMRVSGPSELLDAADVTVILKLTKTVYPGEIVEAEVLATVKGSAAEKPLRLRYPCFNHEEAWAHIPPYKGTVLLAFLKRRSDGIYAAAYALERRETPEADSVLTEELFDYSSGNQCLKPTRGEDAPEAARLLSQYVQWSDLYPEKKSGLIKASLTGPVVMRHLALDFLIHEDKIDFERREQVTDDIVAAILANGNSSDASIKQKAFGVLTRAFHTRKDLAPYLIDALDDPQLAIGAAGRLDGDRGWGPGPVLDKGATTEEKAALLKKWWATTGSKDPAFRRFVPREVPKLLTTPIPPASRPAFLPCTLPSGDPPYFGFRQVRIRTHIEPVRDTVPVGEPVVFKCVIENVGGEAIKLYLNRFTHFWSVEAKGPKVSEHQLPPGPGLPGDQGFREMRPGDAFTFEWSPDGGNGNRKWTLDAPGEYQIRLIYEVRKDVLDKYVEWVRGRGLCGEDKWLGRLRSNVSTVTLVRAEEAPP